MSLLALPDELILQVIGFVKVSYSAPPDVAPTIFYNWTEQSARYLSCLDDVCGDLLNLSKVCRKLYRLGLATAYETISPRQWTKRDDESRYGSCVKGIYAGGQQSIAYLKSLPRLRTVVLHDMWEFSALFNYPIRQPEQPYNDIGELHCINSSLGLWALRELFAAFPKLEVLWYEHGVYETMLNEPRKFWSARNFSSALSQQRSTLRTLVLTRETDALLNGHRAQHPAHVDLSGLNKLEHLRISEVFLFCRVQIQHHQIEMLEDRLPSSIKTLAVFYDEPREVRFQWEAPPGLEASFGVETWPRWPLGLANEKLAGAFGYLESVTILEKARPQPLKYGHLDDDHDGVAPEEPSNRRLPTPRVIDEICSKAKLKLRALVNVGRMELR